MKKFIYIILFTCFLFSCGENDYTYNGKTALTLGLSSKDTINFVVDEENYTYQLPYSLLEPAKQDFNFEVEVVQNTGGDVVSINGGVLTTIPLKINKGDLMGHIEIKVDYDKLLPNIDDTLSLRIKNKEKLDCMIVDSVSTYFIRKFCVITSERIKEWEGIYKEKGNEWYEMSIKQVEGNIFQIDNFWGYNAYPANLSPIKIELDYSTKNYTVKVINGHFFDDPSYGPLDIQDNFKGEPLVPKKIDFCSKEMNIYYSMKVALGYFAPQTTVIYKIRELP